MLPTVNIRLNNFTISPMQVIEIVLDSMVLQTVPTAVGIDSIISIDCVTTRLP
jgi:hypothetical protein